MHSHHSALGLATAPTGPAPLAKRPVQPVTLIRPHAARRAARFFVEKFPGRSLYAVKANPSPDLLRILWEEGVTHYDVASIAEVRLVAETLPEAVLCFMHPVKAEEAIAEAYFTHNVRTFSLDTEEELEKIVRATATDGSPRPTSTCLVRIRVSSRSCKLSLAAKFGAEPAEMKALLMATRQAADALGICFHVGSQAMTPAAYGEAMERVRAAIVEAAVTVDIVDVGGGFPSFYPGHGAAAARNLFRGDPQGVRGSARLLFVRAVVRAGPGALRRICERAGPRREAPRRHALHQRRRLWRLVRRRPCRLALPGAAGPRGGVRTRGTWRSASTGRPATISTIWRGRSMLPADIEAGDYVEIGMLGAYGCAMRTGFNGFGSDLKVLAEDEPMATLYGGAEREVARSERREAVIAPPPSFRRRLESVLTPLGPQPSLG